MALLIPCASQLVQSHICWHIHGLSKGGNLSHVHVIGYESDKLRGEYRNQLNTYKITRGVWSGDSMCEMIWKLQNSWLVKFNMHQNNIWDFSVNSYHILFDIQICCFCIGLVDFMFTQICLILIGWVFHLFVGRVTVVWVYYIKFYIFPTIMFSGLYSNVCVHPWCKYIYTYLGNYPVSWLRVINQLLLEVKHQRVYANEM